MRYLRNIEDENGDLLELVYYCSWLCYSTEQDETIAALHGGAWPCLDSELDSKAACRSCGAVIGEDERNRGLRLRSAREKSTQRRASAGLEGALIARCRERADEYSGDNCGRGEELSRTPKAPVTPALLSWAREIAGYAPSEVAGRVGVTEERLSSWEDGTDQPTLAQVRKLAQLYRRTPALFFLVRPPAPDLPDAPDFRGLSERGRLSPRLRREMRAAAERRAAYVELHGESEFKLADIGSISRSPEMTARNVRDKIGITVADQFATRDADAALALWRDAIESAGVLVFQMSRVSLSEARGFSVYEPIFPIIVLNGADPPQARCFTLFHEIGHLLESSGGVCGWTDDAAERRCNTFAADVLMPRDDFLRELGIGDPVEMIGPLARRFRVSFEAAAIRLRVLDKLTQDHVDQVREESARRVAELRQSQRDREGGPPHFRTHLRNLGRPYVEAVLWAYGEDRITFADAAHYLDAKVSTIERMEEALRSRAAG